MKKNILLIDNFDSFTFNLVDFFEIAGAEVHVVRNDVEPNELELDKYDLVVLSPGPSIPKNAGNLMKIIDLCIAENKAIFGVCLGHEALAEHFGGTLRFVEPVHGKASPVEHNGETIYAGLPNPLLAGRYHSLAIDAIPDCFIVTGRTADGTVMSMQHESLPIESVQFHPESVLTMKDNNGQKMVENVMALLK